MSLAQETDTKSHVVTIGFEVLLELLEKHWIRVERIGADAEKRGEKIGMKPSWEDGHLIERSRTAMNRTEFAGDPNS